jgi:hypothetical protein
LGIVVRGLIAACAALAALTAGAFGQARSPSTVLFATAKGR